jgi:large repetitive protein
MRAKYLLIIMVLLLFLLANFGYAKIEPKNAVAIWTFDDGQGTVLKDSTGNGINGKLMNNPKWVKGKIGSALEFDGKTTYVDCGNNAALTPVDTNQLTVTAWILCTGSGKITIIENNSDNWGFRFAESVPQLDAYVDPDGNDIHVYGPNIIQKEWVHLAFAWDGKTGILYQNGAKLADAAIALKMRAILSGFAIGRRGNTTDSQYFAGDIDEIGIFNVALAAADIGTVMSVGLEKAIGLAPVEPAGKLAATWGQLKQ